MIEAEAEWEDSEGDVDISGDIESISSFDWDGSESDDSETGSSSSEGSDGGDGGGHDIEMPQVRDVIDAEGDGEEEGEDEKILRARIRA